MPKLSGNKGEWSEIYAFLRLLEIKKLYAADAELNKKDDMNLRRALIFLALTKMMIQDI